MVGMLARDHGGYASPRPWWVCAACSPMVGVYSLLSHGGYVPGLPWWVCTRATMVGMCLSTMPPPYPGWYTHLPTMPPYYTPGIPPCTSVPVSARLLTMGVSSVRRREPWAQEERFTLGGERREPSLLPRCERRAGTLRKVLCSLRVELDVRLDADRVILGKSHW